MSTDELTIRDLVALWHSATARGDVDTLLRLMAPDAIFLRDANLLTEGS